MDRARRSIEVNKSFIVRLYQSVGSQFGQKIETLRMDPCVPIIVVV